MDQNRLKPLVLSLITALLGVTACNKEKKTGSIRTDDIKGEWQEVCKFYDTDSNGLDDGDVKYPSNPQDSFAWIFNPDNHLQYKENGKIVYNGYWFLTWPSKSGGVNELLLYPDPDLNNYVYKIQEYNSNHLVIYCKQFVIEFSQLKYKWFGWELKR